jgi:hypothetical protein
VPAVGPPEAGALCDRCAWQRAAPSDTGEATRPRSGRLRGSAFEAHSGGTATWRRPKQVVERHVEAFNGRRTDAEPSTEDAEFVAPGASMRGREEVLAFLGAFWEAFPDGRLELCGSSARARSPRLRGGSLARTAACSVRPLAKSRRPVGSSTSAGCPPTRLAATSSPRSIWSSIKWSSSPSSASCSSVPGRRSHDRAGVPTQGTPVASPPAISTGFERRSRWHRRGHVKRSARRLNTLPQQLGGLLSALK